MKLYVIAGHGQGDPGACANGYSEAERVRALANRLVALGGSDVGLYPTDKDLYQQGGPWDLGVGKDIPCLELHMDSASASAKGGHVIIKSGFSADSYDSALATFVSGFFPGRSQSIVGRSDLQNINVAASSGQNYRLLECCFITNPDDITKFNNNLDVFARGILACFGIETEGDDMQPADVWNYTYAGSPNCFNALHWTWGELSRTDNAGGLGPDSGVNMYGRVCAIDGYAGKILAEVTRTDDPTGREQNCTTHEHVKWIAASINGEDGITEKIDKLSGVMKKMNENLQNVKEALDKLSAKEE